MSNSPNLNPTLHELIVLGDLLTLSDRIASGEDLEESDINWGMTPLELACHLGKPEIVTLLLNNGVGANSLSVASPLYLAAENGNEEVIQILIQGGADVRFIHEQGWSPLFEAACHGHLEACRLLIESGSDPNLEDDNGLKPIVYAARNGYTEVVEYLAQFASAEEANTAFQETLEGKGAKARKKRERKEARI